MGCQSPPLIFLWVSFFSFCLGTTLSPSGEERDNYEREKKDWLIWVQATCFILAILGIVAKLYTKCQSCCKCCGEWRCLAIGDQEAQIGNTDLVICYLCNKKVLRSEWEKEETDHRSYCAVKSKEHRGEEVKKKKKESLPYLP